MKHKLATDSLGFPLEVEIIFSEEFNHRGRHVTYEGEGGRVAPDAKHTIQIKSGIDYEEKAEVVAHEVYHLFYSIRPLITAGEEDEALVFGQLVKHILGLPEAELPAEVPSEPQWPPLTDGLGNPKT